MKPDDIYAILALLNPIVFYLLGRWHGVYHERKKSLRSVMTLFPNEHKQHDRMYE